MEERIGQYTIVEELGRGGMGVVYKAHDPSLDRFVAIKVLGTHLTEDPSYVQRFRREARAAAALNHPNIVQIYTTGEDGDRHYFVMEYVRGTSVQELIRTEGRLEPGRSAGIILQVASGLAAAHAAGILHRDIKPGNLMVDESGIVKIADFGLAVAPMAATRLTATGMLMGTPGYLSPEQCLDRPADRRSDIYSLGATFFEMLAGRTPFTADSPLALLRKIVEVDTPDVGELNPDVAPELRRIVAKMMAKDPDRRYQACDEIVTDLRRWMEVSGAGSSIAAEGTSRAAAAVATGAAQSATMEQTPTRLVDAGSIHATAPPPPPPAPTAQPAAAAPPPPPPQQPRPDPASQGPGGTRRALLIAVVIVVLLLGLAGAGVVAWKLGAGRVAALSGAGPGIGTAAGAQDTTAAGGSLETADAAAVPQGFGDVSGVEVEGPGAPASRPQRSTARNAAMQSTAPAAAADSTGPATKTAADHAAATLPGSSGGVASAAGAAPGNVKKGKVHPAAPPTGTIVLAVGENLPAGEAGRYLRERLSKAGIELAEIDDFPRALDLVQNNQSPATNEILSRLQGQAAGLVLVRATYLGSRELSYMGRGRNVAETGRIRMTGSGLETQRTYTGGNPDQAHRSRLTVTCYDLATTHTLAPAFSTTVEYTQLNAGRNVEGALAKEAGEIIDLMRR